MPLSIYEFFWLGPLKFENINRATITRSSYIFLDYWQYFLSEPKNAISSLLEVHFDNQQCKRNFFICKEKRINERWRSYFNKVLNKNHVHNLGCLASSIEDKIIVYIHRIRTSKVNEVIKKMKVEKTVGPDNISIPV